MLTPSNRNVRGSVVSKISELGQDFREADFYQAVLGCKNVVDLAVKMVSIRVFKGRDTQYRVSMISVMGELLIARGLKMADVRKAWWYQNLCGR